MLKKIWKNSPVDCILIIIMVCFLPAMFFLNTIVAVVQAAAIVVMSMIIWLRQRSVDRDMSEKIEHIISALNVSDRESLARFPIPVLVSDSKGHIVWYNDVFKKSVVGENSIKGNSAEQFTGIDINRLRAKTSFISEYSGRIYSVYTGKFQDESVEMYAMYFFDETEQRLKVKKYEESSPCVMTIIIDNLDELSKNMRESEKAEIAGNIEKLLEDWLSGTNGFVKRMGTSRFFAVCEEKDLKHMMGSKFDILDRVRSFKSGQITGVTLSIGVGHGESLSDCEEMSKQALDMALGRGGDQVAVKNGNSFKFYGGTSKSMEKRTKVKTRIIATALSELLESSGDVYIMGHRFADFDAVGASIGIYCIAEAMGKRAHIVLDRDKNFAHSLLERIDSQGKILNIVSPEEALNLAREKSILIITDTHRADLLESKSLYDMMSTIVVIDHHRKTVDYIDDAVLFYHEPSASSASEMVTELIQYMKMPVTVDKISAEALLSGIMLDTKDFVVRTGVRTFEAAAYLKSRGADTIEVKKLFSNKMENYILRAKIISHTEIYKGCAIASTQSEIDDIRVISSQAADELLTIDGVRASFVLYESDGGVSVSARSMGDINVQLIMEILGGGGHHTMAAAQLKGVDFDSAKEQLLKAIDQIAL